MEYYYEYKEKNGCKVSGHNLRRIEIFEHYITLMGADIICTINGFEIEHWSIPLDMKEIKYLKIEPMPEKED